MFVIAPDTLANRSALDFKQVPRRFLRRAFVWPRREVGWRTKARLIFEIELLRYLVALAPFAIGALIWRDNALAIAQAPLVMILVVYTVEMRLLRPSAEARKALLPPAERDRGLDTLTARGRQLLTRIAAGRRLAEGRLHLVVEQSELARVAPLTLVTVQWEPGGGRRPSILDLDEGERRLIRDTLFAPPLTEAALHRIALARAQNLHMVTLDLRTIPAHDRMAALTGVA